MRRKAQCLIRDIYIYNAITQTDEYYLNVIISLHILGVFSFVMYYNYITMLLPVGGCLYLISLIFIYSTFSGNLVSEEELQIYNSTQCGAVSSLRFPVRFSGTNQLLNNVGGGLSAIGTVVNLEGSLLVHNNTATIGGGILLRDLCPVWPCISVHVCNLCTSAFTFPFFTFTSPFTYK